MFVFVFDVLFELFCEGLSEGLFELLCEGFLFSPFFSSF